MKHIRHCALVVLLALMLPTSVLAQAQSHAYVEAGAGATDLNGRFEWVLADGPIGVGADFNTFSRHRRRGTMYLQAWEIWA